MSDRPRTLLAMPGAKGKRITILPNRSSEAIIELIRSIIAADSDIIEPFFILDLGIVVDLFHKWTNSVPNVRPFYAVKFNTEPALLGTLAALGSCFDCASRAEMEAVFTTGVPPNRIVYANTCKPLPHIKYAASNGVNLATFDSIFELEKIHLHHAECSLLLRIKAPDETGARIHMGAKFGAEAEEVTPLLLAAKTMKLNIIGVSFHVGSAATNFETYRLAIASSRAVFDVADQLGGMPMHMLNIGGGFTAGPCFDEAAEVIKSSIGHYFADRKDLKLMAEPGRFFAETAFSLTTNIIGKRVRGQLREYWIDDGLHGSMCLIKNSGAPVSVIPLPKGNIKAKEEKHISTVFGPTCDAGDRVMREVQLPELSVGDSFVSHNMGAYALSMGTSFNGFITSNIQVHLAYSG